MQVPSVVPQLTGLLRLQLDWNALEELPDGLTALQRLQALQLSGNQLTGVPLQVLWGGGEGVGGEGPTACMQWFVGSALGCSC